MAATPEEIMASIKEHLVGRGLEVAEISMSSDLVGELGLDSLDTVELALGLEENYGVEIPESSMEDVVTVGDVVKVVQEKLAAVGS